MHLSTEESPVSWMVILFGEVGGGVPEYLSSGEVSVKSSSKTIQLESNGLSILLHGVNGVIW